jgi:AcrR family transcriptional regulator
MTRESYARGVDGTANAQRSRAERRGEATAETRGAILAAARMCLLRDGYASLSTRNVAEAAGVPLSQIHYHYGSKQELILAVLAAENERLLERQAAMYAGSEPLWRQWEQACEFLEVDLESGYVRILQELIAAGWSDPTLAASVREQLGAWYRLLADVARREERRAGRSLGPFTPEEVAALMGLPFLGAEAAILLGIPESELPTRSALRKIGLVLRDLGERTNEPGEAITINDGRHADGRGPTP